MAPARTALLTGGVGWDRRRPWFARDGYDVVLTARDEEALNRLADEMRQRFRSDAPCSPATSLVPAQRELVAALDRDSIQVDVLRLESLRALPFGRPG